MIFIYDKEFEWEQRVREFDEMKNRFYSSTRWQETKAAVIEREDCICQVCGEFIVGRTQIDHILEISYDQLKEDDEELYNMENLQLLCVP